MILHTVTAGAGSPVVLLHGLFGSAQSFSTLQRHLAGRRRVLAVDLRNHGASPHARGMDYPSLAADVLETLANSEALPCALVGHSMGGKVAMRLALDQPSAVTRLLISDIAPRVYHAVFGDYVTAMARLDGSTLTRTQASAALATDVPDPAVRNFLLQNFRPGPPASWRIGLAEIADAMSEIEDWPATEAIYAGTALFVAGAQSDYIRPTDRSVIRGLFPSAHFVSIKNAGHWVHADNFAAFLAVLQAFLTTT